jgi:hypothetical protein
MRRVALTLALLAVLALPTSVTAQGPRLSYAAAKRAAQAKADRFAGARTRITALYKLGAATYSASAEWTRVNPTGCTGCGYDPVTGSFYDTPRKESCSVIVKVRKRRSGRVASFDPELHLYLAPF